MGSIPMLRHTLATLAYRGGKVLRDVPPGFEEFSAGSGTRSAGQILVHLCDLFDWAASLADGAHVWHDTRPTNWAADVARFFACLERFDTRLSAAEPLGTTAEKLFQGPVADALTHIGQLAALRRMAGAPVRGENYFKADILAGRVGLDQAKPRVEFD